MTKPLSLHTTSSPAPEQPASQLLEKIGVHFGENYFPVIKAETEGDIANAFNDCCDRWLSRIKEKASHKEQIIVDEFTNLKSLIGNTAVNFFKMSLTDTRKAKTFLLGITHNTTNESFPDGTAAARKAGSILIEKFSANGEW